MSTELVNVEGHVFDCVCDNKSPFAFISELARSSSGIVSESSELIGSSGEHSRITFMCECHVTLTFKQVTLQDVKLLVKQDSTDIKASVVLGKDLLCRLQE